MYITGLDVGTFSTKVVVVKKQNGRTSVVKVIKERTQGFRKGTITDFKEALIFLRKIIQEITNQTSRRCLRNVFFNINSPLIKVYLSQGVAGVARADNRISQDDVDKAIESSRAVNLPPNFTILHNITREFQVDGISEIKNPVGMIGTRLEVSSLVIAIFEPVLRDLTNLLEKCGVTIGGLIYNPLATAEATLSKQQKELGTIVIDIGASTTSYVVYSENKVMQANSFPVGGENITNDIAVGLKIPIDAAEKIKLRYGAATTAGILRKKTFNLQEIDSTSEGEISQRFVAEIIEARLSEILELVQQDIKLPRRQLPGGVVLCGGTAKLFGIENLAKQQLKLPAQVSLPNLSSFDITEISYQDLLNDPEFCNVVGLVLTGENLQAKTTDSIFKRLFKNLMP